MLLFILSRILEGKILLTFPVLSPSSNLDKIPLVLSLISIAPSPMKSTRIDIILYKSFSTIFVFSVISSRINTIVTLIGVALELW